MIYLDNAATSWPKPEQVYDAVSNAIKRSGNPSRSNSEEARAAATDIIETRGALAQLFNIADPQRIVFALNATDAINLGLQGMLKPGDHVITSQMEHNAVTRPLAYLEDAGVMVTKVNTDPVSGADLDEIRKSIRPETKLVAMTHASNVTGALNPIEEIGAICREAGVPFLVDASQTAGAIPIDVVKMNIDLLAFPGHKSLLGPTGTGALYVSETVSPRPIRSGGTGVFSEVRLQPEQLPYYYEAGTQNTVGISGLCAGVHYIMERSVSSIYFEEQNRRDLRPLRRYPLYYGTLRQQHLFRRTENGPTADRRSDIHAGRDCLRSADLTACGRCFLQHRRHGLRRRSHDLGILL